MIHDAHTSPDDLQSEQIQTLLRGQVDLARQHAVLLTGQEHLARQMAEIVIAHQDNVRWHDETRPRIDNIEEALKANSEIAIDLKEMVATMNALKGGMRVLGWIGQTVKWFTLVGAPLYVAFYALTHGGKLPHQ